MPQRDAIGLYGDFWTRLLLVLLRVFPAWFCNMMTWPLAVVFYCMATPQRTTLIANLRGLHPQWGRVALWWGGYRVFVQFALTYMDRLWSQHLGKSIRWEFQEREALVNQLERDGGVLLFVTHSGNYDIGAEFFAREFVRPIHVVRVPERTAELQKFRSAELSASESRTPKLRVHYVRDEWSLGLQLCQLLRDGEVVAVQGDRPVSGSAPLNLEYNGRSFSLPRGPLILAQISKVPCFGVFLTRSGRCRYRFRSGPAFYTGNPELGATEIGRAWLSQLAPFVHQHWDQWYIFDNQVTGARVRHQ